MCLDELLRDLVGCLATCQSESQKVFVTHVLYDLIKDLSRDIGKGRNTVNGRHCFANWLALLF